MIVSLHLLDVKHFEQVAIVDLEEKMRKKESPGAEIGFRDKNAISSVMIFCHVKRSLAAAAAT